MSACETVGMTTSSANRSVTDGTVIQDWLLSTVDAEPTAPAFMFLPSILYTTVFRQ